MPSGMATRTGLLLVDLQGGMFESDGRKPVVDGIALLERIEALLGRARATGTPVFHVRHAGGQGDRLERNGAGWEIHPRLLPFAGEPVIDKDTPDSFRGTRLAEALSAQDVGRLVLAGLQTEYCIDTTCRSAFGRLYRVVLVADGHSTWDTADLTAAAIIAHHNRVLADWFATLRPAAAIDFRGAEP